MGRRRLIRLTCLILLTLVASAFARMPGQETLVVKQSGTSLGETSTLDLDATGFSCSRQADGRIYCVLGANVTQFGPWAGPATTFANIGQGGLVLGATMVQLPFGTTLPNAANQCSGAGVNGFIYELTNSSGYNQLYQCQNGAMVQLGDILSTGRAGGQAMSDSQPTSVSGNGTAASTILTITGAAGGNTTGTTGQTAGMGGGFAVTSGNGGTAPSGSTNGQAGTITIQVGTNGQGAGTPASDLSGAPQSQSGGVLAINPNGIGRVAIGVGIGNPDAFFQINAPQPPYVSTGNGTTGVQHFSVGGNGGGNTLDATGKTAGTGGSVIIIGGTGGAAPSGSTDGTGGLVEINAGPGGTNGVCVGGANIGLNCTSSANCPSSSCSTGTAGAHGTLYLQLVGGNTYIGGTAQIVGALTLTNLISTYNNIATVSNGVPSEVAKIDSPGLSAAVAATNLYLPAATGLYRVSAVLQVTTAATTSSKLGGTTGVVLTYTDGDGSVAQSVTIPMSTQAGLAITPSSGNSGNTTTTNSNGVLVVYAKTGVQMQYAIGYTSTGTTSMVYAAHLKVEAM